ncbi:hypothetical protein C8F01DRAFT_1106081 [Mycena amicta]|nr:hypothetical protein C8F01DRAFT_1106081 [Mycena amicta]
MLREAVRGLTSIDLRVDKLYPLPYWATLLDHCDDLQTLDVYVDSNGWASWTAEQVLLPIPKQVSTTPSLLRLRSLCAGGDVKILTPLAAWLLPRGALDNVQSLALDVYYLHDDYGSPEEDRRPPLVHAAMGSVKALTLHLDPPMPLKLNQTLADFPHLRALHLRDGPDAEFDTSLQWIVAFLTLPSTAQHSSLEEITLDHGVLRRDLLAVPGNTWTKLQDALLGPSSSSQSQSSSFTTPYPALRTVTFANPHKFSYTHPDSVPAAATAFFEDFVKGKMDRMADYGVLRFVGDDYELRRRMWGRGMVS